LIIRIKMNICNSQDPTKCSGDIEAVVDSGSFNTWIPRKKALEIDLREVGRKRFRTINGEIVERPYGVCVCTVAGASGGTEVVFGEDSDATVLGAFTMEALGIMIDPKNGRITKEDVFLAL
jgi:predicted aspartyl protease